MLNQLRKPLSVWAIVIITLVTFLLIWGVTIGCAQGLEECRTYTYTINGTSAIVTKCCVDGDCTVMCSGDACELIRIDK